MAYTITSDSNSSLFSSTLIDGSGNLTLAYALSTIGSSMLTVQAKDALGQSVSTNFTVTVAAGNSNIVGTVLTLTGQLERCHHNRFYRRQRFQRRGQRRHANQLQPDQHY